MTKSANQIEHGTVSFGVAPDATLVVRFSGSWHLDRNLPPATELIPVLDARPTAKRISFDTTALADWDSGLLSFLTETDELCRNRGIVADRAGLPTGLRRLLELAEAVPEKKGTQAAAKRESFFARVGNSTLAAEASAREFLSFVGQLTIAFGNLLRGRARYRSADLIEVIQQCGASAVGIVTLISFLVGVILAFMGAVQLSQFGAAIYVADLVGIGMVREMGAMMTAIIMSGRTGAAFAAKLGTMKVTEEIDALTTMGISPLEFLVLPRVLGLVLMMPLLCLYADFVGILGGLFVGVTMLGLAPGAYMRETISTLTMANLLGGLFKATFYGTLIAIAGCLRGFQCGNSSSAVGDAATQAVVMSIVLVVIACGTFAVLFNVLGI
ncbi:MAG TPA: ABC transporter permease [Gemmata sp.]|jgi:phospholipid/cholesterol/gamma-HCH transport system permease protein|nr:ABC transporter permease [Gemmata sp.]